MGFSWHNISYSILQPYTNYAFTEIRYEEINSERFSTILPTVSWVFDNSVFGFTGPVDGFRQNTSLTFSPGYGTDSLYFQTVKIFFFFFFYTLALRTFVGKVWVLINKSFLWEEFRPYLQVGEKQMGKKIGVNTEMLFLTSNSP